MPTLHAEDRQKEGGKDDNGNHAPCVDRVQLAELAVRILGGDGGNRWSEKDLGKPTRCGEKKRSHKVARKGVILKHHGSTA